MVERKPFLLRIDAGLYAALARWADDELRSLNGQIEFLLRRALAGAGRLPSVSPPPSGVPAQGRLPSVSPPPSGVPAQGRPPARQPVYRQPPDWDAKED